MQFTDSDPYFSEDEDDHQIFDYFMYHQDDSDCKILEKDKKFFSGSKFSSTINPKQIIIPTLKSLSSPINIRIQLNQTQIKRQHAEITNVLAFDIQTNPSEKERQNSHKYSLDFSVKSTKKKIVKRKNSSKSLITLNIEAQSQQSRQIKLFRYRQKKLKRNWQRGILYEERKKLAFRRVRIQGRFQSKNQMSLQLILQKKSELSLQEQNKPRL